MAHREGIPERYEVLAVLGSGGQGKVFRAHDRKMDRPVAIKLVEVGMPGDASALARFRREATLLSSLRHPALVRIYDAVVGPRCYLVQELVEGADLERRLATHGPLKEEEALDLARQVASGLAYLHGEKVLHRDLKPANLIRGDDGRWRIMDFGLARPLERTRITASQWFVGTMAYMPPEVARGGEYRAASDVYQFGLVLHEALTGENPNLPTERSAFCLEWIASPSFRPRPPSASLPRDLGDCLRSCLDVDPLRRPTDGSALEVMLHPLPSGSHVAVPPPSAPLSAPIAPLAPSPSGRRFLVALPLLLGLLVGLGLLFRNPTSPEPTPHPPPSPTDHAPPGDAALLERLATVVHGGVENDPAGMLDVLVRLEEALRPRRGAPAPVRLLDRVEAIARHDALVPPMIRELSSGIGAPPSATERRDLERCLDRLWKRPVASVPLARRCLLDAWLRFRLAARLAAEPPDMAAPALGALVENGLLRLGGLPAGSLEGNEARTLEAVLFLVEELEGRAHPLGSLLDEAGVALILEADVRPPLASWGPSASIEVLGARLLGLTTADDAVRHVRLHCLARLWDSYEGVHSLLNSAKRRSIGLLVRTIPSEIRGELDRALLAGQRRFRALGALAVHEAHPDGTLFDRLLKDACASLNLQEPVEDLTRGPRYWPPSLRPDRIVLRALIWLRRLAWRAKERAEEGTLAGRLHDDCILILRLSRVFRYVWLESEGNFETRWNGMGEDLKAAGGRPWARVARVLVERARRDFARAGDEADGVIHELIALQHRVGGVTDRTAWTLLVLESLRTILVGATEEEERRLRKVAEPLAPLAERGPIDESDDEAVKARLRLKRLLAGEPIRNLW